MKPRKHPAKDARITAKMYAAEVEQMKRALVIDWVDYVTLCGRPDENPKDASLDHHRPRPVGVCPSCWRKFRADMYAAFGAFIGTDGVVVSHIAPSTTSPEEAP